MQEKMRVCTIGFKLVWNTPFSFIMLYSPSFQSDFHHWMAVGFSQYTALVFSVKVIHDMQCSGIRGIHAQHWSSDFFKLHWCLHSGMCSCYFRKYHQLIQRFEGSCLLAVSFLFWTLSLTTPNLLRLFFQANQAFVCMILPVQNCFHCILSLHHAVWCYNRTLERFQTFSRLRRFPGTADKPLLTNITG